MKAFKERDFITYPRQFTAYKWFKPLLVGALFLVFLFITDMAVQQITKAVFQTVVTSAGYDDLDFYSAAGAFKNCAMIACYIPSLLLAALIVRDRPISSYWSSMGGWRWDIFLKMLAVGFVIFAIPNIIPYLLAGTTGEIEFTPDGLIMLLLFLPFQCIAEELLYRSYVMQTVGSWFKVPVIGLIVQIVAFAAPHSSYNVFGMAIIASTALVYGLICMISKGIEASSAFHLLNNATAILMAGFGFASIASEQTVLDLIISLGLKLVLLLFVLYADRKLHWFDEVKKDDITAFNQKPQRSVQNE